MDRKIAWPHQPVPDNPSAAAEQFWVRWFELLPAISAALGDGEPQRVERALCTVVARLHPRLQFSLERGRDAVYALVLSGQEDPELRPFTDAWKAAGPEDDALWEYHDSVPPVPDPSAVAVNFAKHRIALADVRVAVDVAESDSVVDVAIYHPAFAELEGAARTMLTFLSLDATLGERVAARRLRRVDAAPTEPEGAITLGELRGLVEELEGNVRERCRDDVGGCD